MLRSRSPSENANWHASHLSSRSRPSSASQATQRNIGQAATYFGKTRLVPLHATAIEALDNYIRRRGQLYPCPQPRAPAVFISAAGTRLIYNSVNFTFLKLARRAGLQARSPTCRPRAHDLRHTMAVRTVLDAYHKGADVQAQLSVLSTYLGHVNPSNTYWYLSAAPELLAIAGERLQQHLDQLGDQP